MEIISQNNISNISYLKSFILQRWENTDLKHNDESQSCCQNVPELQGVWVRLSWVWRLPIVTIPARSNTWGQRLSQCGITTTSLFQQYIHKLKQKYIQIHFTTVLHFMSLSFTIDFLELRLFCIVGITLLLFRELYSKKLSLYTLNNNLKLSEGLSDFR